MSEFLINTVQQNFKMKPNNHFFSFKNQNSLNMSKKVDFENPKVANCDFTKILVLYQSPKSTVFSINT